MRNDFFFCYLYPFGALSKCFFDILDTINHAALGLCFAARPHKLKLCVCLFFSPASAPVKAWVTLHTLSAAV